MQNKKQLSKAENNFHFIMSRVSHEIRNPVALIGSELQMIEAAHPEVTGYDYWNDILDNLDYIKQLLNDLSDYKTCFEKNLYDRLPEFHPFQHNPHIPLSRDCPRAAHCSKSPGNTS